MPKRSLYAIAIACALGLGLSSASSATPIAAQPGQKPPIIIGTGSVTGAYFPTGGAICQLVNRSRKTNGLHCYVESTNGSIFNIRAMQMGEVNFGIVQSDWQFKAYEGKGALADSPAYRDLRAVFSLHDELFTIAVSPKSGIKHFGDLKGKRLNLGDKGSGMRAIMEELIEAHDWKNSDFPALTELNPGDAAKALCEGKIDAMAYISGHPNGMIQEITSACGAKLIAVEDAEISQMLKENPYYARGSIPANMYRNNPQSTPSFGVRATLVTTEQMDEETVYQLVKAVFDAHSDFKTMHFVLSPLDKPSMVSSGITAPIHPGALRYYREVGLVK